MTTIELLAVELTALGVTGPAGPQGPTGDTGATGPEGAQGSAGVDGVNGADGAAGADGAQGPSGTDGAAGIDGAAGATGAQGPAGSTGANGDNIYVAYASDASGTGFTNTFDAALDYIAVKTTGTWLNPPVVGDFAGLWKNYKGAAGADGATGAAGADGATGAAGADGATGAAGNTVLYGTVDPTTEGVNGNFYINTTSNFLFGPKASGTWPSGTSLVGPTGATGAAGTVTLAGETYLSLSAQVITAAAVNLSGTHVTGTLADARFPATLPAASGVNLTALNATNLASGTLPAARMPALTGDVTTVAGALATTIANSAVSLAKMANVATASVFYRKTAGTAAPEVNTLATLKTDLGLTGTNSGDQTTIVGIAGTKAQFDTAVSDGNILYVGDAVTGVTGTAPVVSSGGTTPAISIPAATASVAGHMTAAAMTKLNGIATGANLYVHPNHSGVVTSTADGATAIADAALSIAKTSGLQTSLDAKQPLDAALTALAAGSDFVQFTGPTTPIKVFTLPDASSTLLVSDGALGTPSSGVATNLTGTAAGLTAGNVTTNADLTGDVTSVGNATTIGALKVTNPMLEGSIAYSKLVLTGEVLNADLAGSIAVSKITSVDTGDYTPTTGGDWAGTAPATIRDALDRCAALLKTLNSGTGP